jgi:PAS domain S-box-containing protein
VNERTSVPAPAGFIDPANLHRSLLTLVLRVSAILGGLVYVPSVYLSLKRGVIGAVVVDTGALAAVVALLRMQRLPFAWRAAAVCAVYYVLGVGLLLQIGAISQIYLFGFSLVTVLLLGVRAGLGAALLSAASLFAIGLSGLAAPEMQAHGDPHDGYAWFVITLNFASVNTLITLGVGVVLSTLHDALAKEVSSRLARKHAEVERDRLLAQLQLQIERMPLAYVLTDPSLAITGWNEAAERIFGFTEADVLGKHPLDVIVPAGSRAAATAVFERLRAGVLEAPHEAENLHKGGTTITCEWYNTPMLDGEGAFVGLLSLAQDITGRKRLEEQLRQSQKMDAIGQLAGGVAHDFNNLLSVVLSYSDMLLMDLKPEDPVQADIVEIRRAGQRASDLTRQLLMFSRQQVVEPRVLDLNEVLTGVDKMLKRLVGADVEIVSVPGSSLGRVRADPGSIEQVLVNLAVNARDAMPTGGQLTMETANVTLDEEYARTHLGATPGAYVMLCVSDTGTGMDKSTLARIFEPFFTTKEKGRGTGLGLSTVFGIVKQSGGSVWVYSEPGLGTTFKVYLPRVDDELTVNDPAAVGTLRGSETILLVEDEDQVRQIAGGILRRHGYAVLDACNAGEALLLSEAHPGRIHLLLSDVVLPKMSGPALARRLALSRPDMRVLCMSGYTDDAAVRHGVIDAELAYLQKPITVETLTRKVRSVLDAADPA